MTIRGRSNIKQARLPLEITPSNVTTLLPSRNDITFTHPVFVQCFLPLRKLRNNQKIHQVKHGKSSLAIQAGLLLNPKTGNLEEQDVPYGSAARIILAHINNHVIRASSLDAAQEVPMGDSLRHFFRNYRLKINGQNGHQIKQQVNNIAAAHITIGLWTHNQAKQINVPTLADEIDFWLEKDEQQRSLWQPKMLLNRRYVESIKERAVPIDIRALVGLYEKPRAMDVFTWLSYRLPTVKSRNGVFIPYEGEGGLHGIFGAAIQQPNKFRSEFEKTLSEVQKWYPEARITIEKNGIRLFHSPSPVPPEHSISSGKSLFFCE